MTTWSIGILKTIEAIGNPAKIQDVYNSIEKNEYLELPENLKGKRYTNGQVAYKATVNKAMHTLVKTGCLKRVGRGAYSITSKGKKMAQKDYDPNKKMVSYKQKPLIPENIEELSDTLGDRIRYIRGPLSQTAFSKKIGVFRTAFQLWETNKSIPNVKYLIQIYQVFGVNIHWLLTGEGEPYINKSDPINAADISTQTNSSKALSAAIQILDSDTSYANALYHVIQEFTRALKR